MKPDELDILKEHIETVIKVTVNGKIDKLNEKVDEHNRVHESHMEHVLKHMEETKPILEAYNGTKALGNLAKWVAGIVVTVAAAWALIFKQ